MGFADRLFAALIGAAAIAYASAYSTNLRRDGAAALIHAGDPIRVVRPDSLPPEESSEPAAAAGGDGGITQIKREARETFGKVEKVSIRDSVRSDAELIRRYFLPGLEFRWDIFLTTISIVGFSVLWFHLYFGQFYEDDRCETLYRWAIDSELVEEEPSASAAGSQLRPDVVIVFSHPTYASKAKDHQILHQTVSRTLVAEVDSWKVIAPEGEVPIRLAPTSSSPKLGSRVKGDTVRGMAVDGWVALHERDGYISIMEEGQDDDFGGGAPDAKLQPVLEPMLANQAHNDPAFKRLRTLQKNGCTYQNSITPMTHLRRARSALTGQTGESAGESTARSSHIPPMPTKNQAQVAFIQDLYDILPKWGFDLSAFSSIDDDELYVCISLRNIDAQTSYLLRQNTQLVVRKDVVRRLGIDQPPHENASSPPRLRFDPRIVTHLHDQGILENNDPRELYECYHGRDPNGCIVSGKDRFRMIFKELCNYLDLDAAKYDGLVVDWYPCHSVIWLRRLDATWANFRNLCDLTFVQPVCMIQEYFGSRLAFIFAWNGLYAKCLLCLSLLSLVVEVCAGWHKYIHSEVEHIERTVNRRIVFAFSVSITIWGRVAYNLWIREQEYFIKLWDISVDGMQQTVRPSFQGESQPSPADRNVMEKQYPAHLSKWRQMCSAGITIAFCIFVAFIMMLWQNMFQDDMNLVASIVLAVIITIFSLLYDILVPILTDWENHKFQSQYYDSFLWKQFLFQSVNRYFAFFQLAVKQRYTSVGCPAEGCLAIIRMQLVTTLAILSATRIFEVMLASLMVRFKIWLEDYFMKRSAKHEVNPDERSFVELQSKFGESRLQEQIQNMLQLVLSLGFVLLFGAVAPIIVPFCLAVFMVQLRATAFVLLKYTKRTLPRQQVGIGLWRWIIAVLMQGSMLFNGFLIAVYSDLFEGMPMITKMAGVVLYVLCMQLVSFIVDVFVPTSSEEVHVLVDRRRRVKEVIMKRSVQYSAPDIIPQGGSPIHAQYSAEIEAEEWSKIPHLVASSQESTSP